MAKPILVINYCIAGLPRSIAVTNLRDLQNVISSSSANDEYYVFLLPVREDSNIQVFYEKDFGQTSYDELKKLIEEKFDLFKSISDSESKYINYDNDYETYVEEDKEESKITTILRKIGILPK